MLPMSPLMNISIQVNFRVVFVVARNLTNPTVFPIHALLSVYVCVVEGQKVPGSQTSGPRTCFVTPIHNRDVDALPCRNKSTPLGNISSIKRYRYSVAGFVYVSSYCQDLGSLQTSRKHTLCSYRATASLHNTLLRAGFIACSLLHTNLTVYIKEQEIYLAWPANIVSVFHCPMANQYHVNNNGTVIGQKLRNPMKCTALTVQCTVWMGSAAIVLNWDVIWSNIPFIY